VIEDLLAQLLSTVIDDLSDTRLQLQQLLLILLL